MFTLVLGGVAVPVAYQQVADDNPPATLEEVRADTRTAIVHVATRMRGNGMTRAQARARIAEMSGFGDARLDPLIDRAYAGGNARDPEARFSHGVGVLVRRADRVAVRDAILDAHCGDLSALVDGGTTPERDGCRARNGAWFGERYCNATTGAFTWRGARWRETPRGRNRLIAALPPEGVLIDPATDAAYQAAKDARNLINCDDITDGGP